MIHGHGCELRAGHQQCLARSGISRLFEPDALVGIQENLRGELDALLRSGGQDDLLRFDAAARRDEIAEPRQSARRTVLQRDVRPLAQNARGDLSLSEESGPSGDGRRL